MNRKSYEITDEIANYIIENNELRWNDKSKIKAKELMDCFFIESYDDNLFFLIHDVFDIKFNKIKIDKSLL